MAQDDISNLGRFKPDHNQQVYKGDQIKNQPEQRPPKQAPYSSSSMQKSSAESIVLTHAAGLPVLQPPPKTQTKNVYETSAYSAGGTAQAGSAPPLPLEGQTFVPSRTELSAAARTQKRSVLDLEEVLDCVKNLLALITTDTEQVGPDSSAGDQSLRLMLSVMALEMLYLSVYGGISGEEFESLFSKKVDFPSDIRSLAEQLILFIKSHLPSDPKAYREVMAKLMESINSRQSLESLLKATQVLSQALIKGELLEPADAVRGAEIFMQSLDQVDQTKQTIIATIWQNYSKNLAEFSERMKGADIQAWMQEVSDKGTQSSTEYYAFILAKASVQTSDGKNALLDRFSQAFNQWVIDPNKQAYLGADADMMEAYPTSSFIAGCMVCGVDIVREAIKNTSGIFQHQLKDNPIADVLFAVAPGITLYPDYQAAAALIVALLNNGAVYKATEDALKKGKEKGSPPRDLDFAIKYAKHIIAIVTHKSVFSHEQPKEIQERDRLVRLMLCVMALNMLYRSAYGGMTGEEFGAILKGETQDIHDKIKSLIELLTSLVKANLPMTKEARAETILKLMDYVDSKDSIDSMLQSTRILANLLSTKDVDQRRWEAQSG